GLSPGPHTITAGYGGDDAFAVGTSDGLTQVVNRAATGATAAVSAPTPLFGEDGLTVSAVVSVVAPGGGNPSGAVTFYDGTTTLAGTDDLGHGVSRTLQTDANGIYAFVDLRPSNGAGYTVTETQPAGLLDGRETPGTVNGLATGAATVNDTFSGVVLSQGGSF